MSMPMGFCILVMGWVGDCFSMFMSVDSAVVVVVAVEEEGGGDGYRSSGEDAPR